METPEDTIALSHLRGRNPLRLEIFFLFLTSQYRESRTRHLPLQAEILDEVGFGAEMRSEIKLMLGLSLPIP
jgi:hypothetical protein